MSVVRPSVAVAAAAAAVSRTFVRSGGSSGRASARHALLLLRSASSASLSSSLPTSPLPVPRIHRPTRQTGSLISACTVRARTAAAASRQTQRRLSSSAAFAVSAQDLGQDDNGRDCRDDISHDSERSGVSRPVRLSRKTSADSSPVSRLEALRRQLRTEDRRRGIDIRSSADTPADSERRRARPQSSQNVPPSKLPPIPSLESVRASFSRASGRSETTSVANSDTSTPALASRVQQQWIQQLEALPDPPAHVVQKIASDRLFTTTAPASDSDNRHASSSERGSYHTLNPNAVTDTFGRQHSYLRISLSEKCNLRCLYCMPEDGVPLQPPEHLLSNNEIVKLVDWFVTVGGISKLRFTGGEPLLRKNIVPLIRQVRQRHGDRITEIGITTNGVTLSRHLDDLLDAGITNINISLDSLQPSLFAKLTRRPEAYFERVWDAIQKCAVLHQQSRLHTKINCVVMRDNLGELPRFAQLTNTLGIDVRFIEYMPFNDNQWGTNDFISYQDMQDVFRDTSDGHTLQRLQDGPNDTTKWWSYAPIDRQQQQHERSQRYPDIQSGRIGFITSMSSHFCGTCNRLRMTADGQLKVCLFGSTEISLRDLLRTTHTDEQQQNRLLAKVVYAAVQRKHFKLGGHQDMQDISDHSSENRPMTLIGG